MVMVVILALVAEVTIVSPAIDPRHASTSAHARRPRPSRYKTVVVGPGPTGTCSAGLSSWHGGRGAHAGSVVHGRVSIQCVPSYAFAYAYASCSRGRSLCSCGAGCSSWLDYRYPLARAPPEIASPSPCSPRPLPPCLRLTAYCSPLLLAPCRPLLPASPIRPSARVDTGPPASRFLPLHACIRACTARLVSSRPKLASSHEYVVCIYLYWYRLRLSTYSALLVNGYVADSLSRELWSEPWRGRPDVAFLTGY
ncbi:hypothetical protein C8Q80DRAFT_610328 [Daedaleopsis nitida]|nr:hypothetical protein C8Q80DRAFT_610328 [Daedaleopsis nitida]